MTGLIIEKKSLDMSTGLSRDLYAVATNEQTPLSVGVSLTFEAYITSWTTDKATAENILRYIESLGEEVRP